MNEFDVYIVINGATVGAVRVPCLPNGRDFIVYEGKTWNVESIKHNYDTNEIYIKVV